MEDSIGYELFLRRCLNEKEFNDFISSLDEILCDKSKFENICNLWTIFYIDNTKESQETHDYIKDKLPQRFITNEAYCDSHGPFLDIVGIGLRKRIQGLKQIRQYTDKMADYATQRHSIYAK